VDLWGSSLSRGVCSLTKKRDSVKDFDSLRESYQTSIEEVADFMETSARKRLEAVRRAEIHEVEVAIAGEIALAAGLGRLDIVIFLSTRLQQLAQMDSTIKILEEREYRRRFSEPEDLDK
jgi:hypothetical protein